MTEYGTFEDVSFGKDTERAEFEFEGKKYWVEYEKLGWRKRVELERMNTNERGETITEDFLADYITESVTDSCFDVDTVKWVNSDKVGFDFIEKVADEIGIGDEDENLN